MSIPTSPIASVLALIGPPISKLTEAQMHEKLGAILRGMAQDTQNLPILYGWELYEAARDFFQLRALPNSIDPTRRPLLWRECQRILGVEWDKLQSEIAPPALEISPLRSSGGFEVFKTTIGFEGAGDDYVLIGYASGPQPSQSQLDELRDTLHRKGKPFDSFFTTQRTMFHLDVSGVFGEGTRARLEGVKHDPVPATVPVYLRAEWHRGWEIADMKVRYRAAQKQARSATHQLDALLLAIRAVKAPIQTSTLVTLAREDWRRIMDAFTPHQLGREVADAEVPEEATVPVASLSLGRLEEMFGAGKKAFANGVEMAAYFSASTLTPWERFAWTRGWIFAQVEHESRTQTQITRSVQRGRAELLDALKRIGIERDVAGVADVVVPRLDWDCLRETWQRVRANRNVFPVEEKTTVSAAETQIQTPASAPDDSKYFATLVDVGQCLARLPRVRKTATEFGTYVVPMYDWNALFVQIANALGKIERSLGAPVIDVQETAAPPETPVPATALASLETEEAMRRLFTAARAIACKRHNLANPKGAIWVAHAWWLPLAEAVSEIETKGLFSLNGRSQSPMQSPLAPEA